MYTETAELYDLFYDWKDYAAEAEKLHELVESRTPAARTLLDVACGTGRHLDPNFPSRAVVVDRPGLQAVRMNDSRVEGGLSVMDFHYLISRRGQPMEHLVETHTLGL